MAIKNMRRILDIGDIKGGPYYEVIINFLRDNTLRLHIS